MTTESSNNRAKKQELIDALQTARDTVRVQAHLFSLEAKEGWRELEERLLSVESKLEREGESIVESIASTVDELVEATKKMLGAIDGALDTGAPISTIPACVVLAHTLGRISQRRGTNVERLAAE